MKDAILSVLRLLALIYALYAFVFGVPLSPRLVWFLIVMALITIHPRVMSEPDDPI